MYEQLGSFKHATPKLDVPGSIGGPPSQPQQRGRQLLMPRLSGGGGVLNVAHHLRHLAPLRGIHPHGALVGAAVMTRTGGGSEMSGRAAEGCLEVGCGTF